MDSARKKELKEQYRQTRPEMGIYAYRCVPANRVYLGASQNLAGTFNGVRFQLENNGFAPNAHLGEDLKRYGRESISEEVLEKLDYDKDNDLKTDYRDDLAVLKEYWREQLERGGAVVENIRPVDR